MAERKVLNKYFPPDFDPAKLRVRKHTTERKSRVNIRMMLPMNVRCTTCGEFMYRGTKFNTPKEDIVDENYLGIPLFRFYFKCTGCNTYFSLRTDPKNSDYIVEKGATRNFELRRDNDKKREMLKRKREEEEEGDKIKQLENRTMDSKRELDALDALEEIKDRSEMLAAANIDAALEKLKSKTEEETKSQIDQKEETSEELERKFKKAVERRRKEKEGSKDLNLTPEINTAKESESESKNRGQKFKIIRLRSDEKDQNDQNEFQNESMLKTQKENGKGLEKSKNSKAKSKTEGLAMISNYGSSEEN